jgi:hypothetical protein
MCEDCEAAEPLREAYLARRARMARTWRPQGWRQSGRWSVDAEASAAALAAPQAGVEPEPIAAE